MPFNLRDASEDIWRTRSSTLRNCVSTCLNRAIISVLRSAISRFTPAMSSASAANFLSVDDAAREMSVASESSVATVRLGFRAAIWSIAHAPERVPGGRARWDTGGEIQMNNIGRSGSRVR